ncbi:necrotizing toxin immunity factor IFT [Microbacterium awajiense]|uniref:Necrotizing toxin immunity factor IFT n=1 Tax=Microbacterium awajiense TaxID=415214 RepID=A0ABP7ASV2_9MICO
MTTSVLSDAFEAWAGRAGYAVTREDDATTVATEPGGEIRYTVRRFDDEFHLSRAERAEPPQPEMVSTQPADIERYLTVQLGIDLRAEADLPRLRLPFAIDRCAPGFVFAALDGGWATLLCEDRGPIAARFRDWSMHPAVRFSYYAEAELEDLRSSLVAESGAPVFAGMT